jgi:hypothetical protein
MGAADLLEAEGWEQGRMRSYGRDRTEITGRCAEAAIVDAGVAMDAPALDVTHALQEARDRLGGERLAFFNDKPDTTLFDVLDMLRDRQRVAV